MLKRSKILTMDEKDAPESIASVQKQRFRLLLLIIIIQSGLRKEKKKN